jgi:peptide deformylase
MSDILTIDTGAGVIKEERVEPLMLFDENHPMLKAQIPEYKQPLPNANMTSLVKRLKLTMKMYNGIGLSANQCGIFERVFVIGTDQFQMACINPKVIESSADLDAHHEGCLSFPALTLKIERPKSIDVEFTTENGEVKQLRLDGLTARCFQHELDHLNGIKFTKHVGETTMLLARQRQSKMMKKFRKYEKNK